MMSMMVMMVMVAMMMMMDDTKGHGCNTCVTPTHFLSEKLLVTQVCVTHTCLSLILFVERLWVSQICDTYSFVSYKCHRSVAPGFFTNKCACHRSVASIAYRAMIVTDL